MFLIRADGNAKVGAGHLMRCMTVALELAELMGRDDVRFVCADADSAAYRLQQDGAGSRGMGKTAREY